MKNEEVKSLDLNGLRVESVFKTYVLYTEDILNKMLERINKKSNLNLTKEHIEIGFDEEVERAFLYVNEDRFSDEEWKNSAYNLQEWYETFDVLLGEILNINHSTDLRHGCFTDADDYIIVEIHESVNK